MRLTALIGCIILPLLACGLSLSASSHQCATMDEPLHAVGGYLELFHRDFRINPEDPPLWKYWAMLPHARGSLKLDFDDPDFQKSLVDTENHASRISTRALFQTRDTDGAILNDGAAFIQRSQWMMVPVLAAVAWTAAAWLWRISGAVAGMTVTVLLCSDPNFLAHAPLVKNDVGMTFLFLAFAVALWSIGNRLLWWNLLLLGLICGAATATKFSGLLIAPMLIAGLILRALIQTPWPTLKWELRSTRSRFAAAAAVIVFCGVFSWLIIWMIYGFRFRPTPAINSNLNLQSQVRATSRNIFFLENSRFPDDEELKSLAPPIAATAALWFEQHRLLPQPYIFGLLYTYKSSLVRPAYLLGELKQTGWWYYFPLAMLFKTPLAILIAFLLAPFVVIIRKKGPTQKWNLICLLIPMIIYGFSALMTNLNLGLRHILPLYPFFYILIGLAAARIASQRPRLAIIVSAPLVIALLVETAAAYPHFIPFFNAAFRGQKLQLLSDSNLDWGQDLPMLARWRRNHPQGTLYLCYFGTVDPAFFGIRDYVNLPPGFFLGPPYQWPDNDRPGVIAISATYLQGNYLPEGMKDYYRALRELDPIAICGESIYVYSFGETPK